jgi:hypothetical protein
MEVESRSCWFCRRPVLASERANRAPHAQIAVHADCLRADALNENARPGSQGSTPAMASINASGVTGCVR